MDSYAQIIVIYIILLLVKFSLSREVPLFNTDIQPQATRNIVRWYEASFEFFNRLGVTHVCVWQTDGQTLQ